jgi:enoyl-CoA hydratase/carnithine racemase
MLDYRKDGRIAYFTINRPEALNAFTVKGFQEMEQKFSEFRDDDDVWVGIITGAGEKAFSAGADVKEALPFFQKTANKPWQVPRTIMRGIEVWKPLIAGINGYALGGGLELAMACDIRIAADHAKMGLREVAVGMFPGGGGTHRLTRLGGPGIASEMIFTAKMIDAQEAYRIGLVNKVVRLAELMPACKEMAEQICANSPTAVRITKQLIIRGGMNLSLDEGLDLEDRLCPIVVDSEDFQEGIKAFQEKRKPDYQGK